jgi:hypothetical protein
MKEKEALQQPFFARYLENQQAEKRQSGNVNSFPLPPVTGKGKDDLETHKFPSDHDDDMSRASLKRLR